MIAAKSPHDAASVKRIITADDTIDFAFSEYDNPL
jgi:hypothetical protein